MLQGGQYMSIPGLRHIRSLFFSDAVPLVDNPFVPRMALSVALITAAPKARDGQKVLISLKKEVAMSYCVRLGIQRMKS